MQRNFTRFAGWSVLALLLHAFFPALAQDGKLDSTFGTHARVFNPPGNFVGLARIAVLPDGKILHANMVDNGHVLQLSRYLPNGAPDPSFGSAGTVVHPYGSVAGSAAGLALLPDGRFLIAGYHVSGLSVARFLPDGRLDATFAGDGMATANVGAHTETTGLALLPDGRIVLAGYTSRVPDPMLTVARFTPNGDPDPTFDGDGWGSYNINPGTGPENRNGEAVYALAVQPDGKIVLGGSTLSYLSLGYTSAYTDDLLAVRLNPNGSLDPSFATNGVYVLPSVHTQDVVAGIALQPDGKIVLASREVMQNEYFYAYMTRLQGNGTQDVRNGFSHGGTGGSVVDVGIQADGKILLSGFTECRFFCASEVGNDFFIARFLPTGQPDMAFGSEGRYYRQIAYNSPRQPGSNFYTNEVGGVIASQGHQLIIGGYTVQTNYTIAPDFSSSTNNGTETRATLFRLLNSSPLLSENPQYYYPDGDGDGYGTGTAPVLGYAPPSAQYAARGRDCNDANPAIHPGAAEVADGLDNNCNGTVDEGAANNCLFVAIPARLEAESFCRMLGVQNEPTRDTGGGQNVGYIDYGDWMEYNISVPAAGTYTLHFRVATPNGNAQFQVRSGNNLLATVNVPNTGGFQTWRTHSMHVSLAAGNHTLRLTSTGGAYWNINWLQFAGGTPPPVDPVYVTIPAKIEAEAYTAMHGIQKEPTWDAGGGQNVGYIDNGDWMEYKINVPTSWYYNVNFRLASPGSNASFEIRKVTTTPAGTNLVSNGDFSAGNTGFFSGYTYNPSSGFNPGVYNVGSNIKAWHPDMTGCTDHTTGSGNMLMANGGAGQEVVWLQTIEVKPHTTYNLGAWVQHITTVNPSRLQFSVNGTAVGTFTANAASCIWEKFTTVWNSGNNNMATMYITVLSQDYSGNDFALDDIFLAPVADQLNETVLGTVHVPNTGGFQTWQTSTANIPLAAGNQTLRLVSTGGAYWNINWLQFVHPGATTFAGRAANGTVNVEGDRAAVQVFPNPVRENFTMKVDNGLKGQLNVQVAGANGAVLKTFALNKAATGAQSYNLALQNLPKGVYTLQVQMRGWKAAQTIIKQ